MESGRVNGQPRVIWQEYLGTVEAIVARAGLDLSLPALLTELSALREVAILYPPATGGAQDHIALRRLTPRQRKLADILEIASVFAGQYIALAFNSPSLNHSHGNVVHKS